MLIHGHLIRGHREDLAAWLEHLGHGDVSIDNEDLQLPLHLLAIEVPDGNSERVGLHFAQKLDLMMQIDIRLAELFSDFDHDDSAIDYRDNQSQQGDQMGTNRPPAATDEAVASLVVAIECFGHASSCPGYIIADIPATP